MLRLPPRFATIILCFAPLFFQGSWRHAEMLLIGAILTPGRRTVTSILRITGLGQERRFVNFHRVLNRAAWSGRAAARVLLGLLLDAFEGASDPRHRRHHRAPARQTHQGQRDLPRPGPLQPRPLRQGERLALAQPDVAGPGPLGRAGLGAALPDRTGALRAVLPRAPQTKKLTDWA